MKQSLFYENKIPFISLNFFKCHWWINVGKTIAKVDHYFKFRLWRLKWDRVCIGGKWAQLSSDAYIYFN
jgi:hypothetical protein